MITRYWKAKEVRWNDWSGFRLNHRSPPDVGRLANGLIEQAGHEYIIRGFDKFGLLRTQHFGASKGLYFTDRETVDAATFSRLRRNLLARGKRAQAKYDAAELAKEIELLKNDWRRPIYRLSDKIDADARTEILASRLPSFNRAKNIELRAALALFGVSLDEFMMHRPEGMQEGIYAKLRVEADDIVRANEAHMQEAEEQRANMKKWGDLLQRVRSGQTVTPEEAGIDMAGPVPFGFPRPLYAAFLDQMEHASPATETV